MKRHRRHQIGVGQQLRAGPRHPAAAGAGNVSAIAVLERQDQATALVIVRQRRTCPAIARRTRRAGTAQGAFAGMLGEGIGAAHAIGWSDEGEARPAGGAQRTRRFDDLAATQAERRQHRVEHHATGAGTKAPQPGGQHDPIGPAKYADRMAGSSAYPWRISFLTHQERPGGVRDAEGVGTV